MKKIFRKSNIFAFVLGAVIFGGIVGVSAYTIFANDIGYTPKDSTWKVDNVKDAIDDLYIKANNDMSLEHYTQDCHSNGCSLTKTYTADENVIVNVTLVCGGFNGGVTQAVSSKNCKYEGNGTLINEVVLTHVDGGYTYHKVISYKLQKNQYLKVDVASGTGTYWYAGYDMSIIRK